MPEGEEMFNYHGYSSSCPPVAVIPDGMEIIAGSGDSPELASDSGSENVRLYAGKKRIGDGTYIVHLPARSQDEATRMLASIGAEPDGLVASGLGD